jgi:tRNA(Ile)-lysidine synthetase-like protein
MEFELLYDYWFSNRKLWFNCNSEDDTSITNSFGNMYSMKINDTELKSNRKYALGVILLYDQVSRHVERHFLRINKETDTDMIYEWHKDVFVKDMTKIAFANSMIAYCYFKDEVNADEYSFLMLPLRHTRDFKKIKYVMSETWSRIKTEKDEIEKQKYKQFLKATYERSITQSSDLCCLRKYSNLKVGTEEKDNFDDWAEKIKPKTKILKKEYGHILDEKCIDDVEIKEDLEDASLKTVVRTITKQFVEDIKKVPISSFVLSISGGVDSMICSYILKKSGIPFSCVHINYSNREESSDEENFVIEWCRILDVELYIRKIDEINRPLCMEHNMREIYETYTRDVRYGTYLKVASNPYVILGHNQDDCFENILTNMCHKSKYDNLFGMDLLGPIKVNEQVINFVRPMLKISKKNIYTFAKLIDIPYLWDSTPKWSQRGKIRDEVRPVLESWDSELISGLLETSNVLKESLELVDNLVDSWILKIKDEKIECGITNLPKSKIFWKKLFEKLNIFCTTRSLEGLVNLFDKIKNNNVKIDINACIKYEINKEYQFKLMKMKGETVTIFFVKRK